MDNENISRLLTFDRVTETNSSHDWTSSHHEIYVFQQVSCWKSFEPPEDTDSFFPLNHYVKSAKSRPSPVLLHTNIRFDFCGHPNIRCFSYESVWRQHWRQSQQINSALCSTFGQVSLLSLLHFCRFWGLLWRSFSPSPYSLEQIPVTLTTYNISVHINHFILCTISMTTIFVPLNRIPSNQQTCVSDWSQSNGIKGDAVFPSLSIIHPSLISQLNTYIQSSSSTFWSIIMKTASIALACAILLGKSRRSSRHSKHYLNDDHLSHSCSRSTNCIGHQLLLLYHWHWWLWC